MQSGEFRDWVVVLPRSTSSATPIGEIQENWPDPPASGNTHAARLENWGQAETVTDPPRGVLTTVTCRFRHLVTIAGVDRVRVVETGDAYNVTAVWKERDGTAWVTVCSLAGPV